MVSRRFRNRRPAAFTLLELLTCVLVVAILLVMLMPVYTQIVRRMERIKCMSNLTGLHSAANLYLQDHRVWPQVSARDGGDAKTTASTWVKILQPYGVEQINWICPTQQKLLQNPDLSDDENVRVDYIATPFDRNPMTPMRWSTQPWFVESADVHGNGNLLIFPDGHIQELSDFLSVMRKGKGTTGGK